MAWTPFDDVASSASQCQGSTKRASTPARVRTRPSGGGSTETSDNDVLVDLDDGRGLFDLGGLLMDLREILGHDVDVVTEAGPRDRVAHQLFDDAVEL